MTADDYLALRIRGSLRGFAHLDETLVETDVDRFVRELAGYLARDGVTLVIEPGLDARIYVYRGGRRRRSIPIGPALRVRPARSKGRPVRVTAALRRRIAEDVDAGRPWIVELRARDLRLPDLHGRRRAGMTFVVPIDAREPDEMTVAAGWSV